jgi:DNA-binding transcriptional MerR regulator
MRDSSIYSIGAVARMIGVSVSTLRTWEERYGVVVATRSAGGQRRYTRDQLAQLQFVAGEVAAGMLPGDAHRLLADQNDVSPPVPRSESSVLILVADRDPYAASIADYFLRTEGYRVEVARDAETARSLLEELKPGVIVLELLLSGGLGSLLFDVIRRSGARVVVMSALDAPDVASDLGADAFLRKPVDPVVLISTVRDLLGTSALSAQASQRLSSRT